ncbi:hypothetical protein NKR23_g11886 [Pleurostoma richardsiae]|uniref:Uncharacterized protein n=1 Tax=Pleurostoma richardsiae TaxID=41990 RepID=A0AA38VB70_9PEZI|nr:hypothetical protein NKR23_g11886 [Pleurostoma richardsiae]
MPSAVSADPAALPEGASTDSIQQALADLIYGAGAARAAGEDDGDVTPRAPERVRARELRAVGSSPTLGRAETEWRNSMVVTMAAQGRAGGGGGGGGAAQEDQLAPLGGRGAVGAAMGPSSRLAPGVTRAPSKLRKVSTASSEYSQPSVAADISRTTSTSSGGRTVREAPVAMRAETPTQENTSSTSSTSNNNTEDDEGNSTSASENTNAIRNSMLAKSSSSIRTPTRRMSTTSSHRDSGETTPQVAAIVANLRRMNSQVSTYSVSSARSRTSVQLVSTPSAAAAARTGSPTPSSLRSGWGSQLRKGGTRHYLSMGQAPPQYQELGEQQQQRASVGGRSVASPGAQRKRKSGRESKRISIAEDGEEKDAMRRPPSRAGERDGARDSKLGRVRVTEMEVTSTGSPKRQTATTTTTTPVKRVSYLKNADATPERRSEDSLGLYDKDGFLIPSPEKVLIASGKKRKGSIRV